MKNSRRFFVSGLVVFVLLFSVASQALAAKSRKRCPVRIPDSLLTLYLKSDLIVRGSISGGKFLKKTTEYDYGYYFTEEKSVRVAKTLKGIDAKAVAFVISKFKSTQANENERDNDEEGDFYGLKTGDEALFFLVKNEDNSYELADRMSGVKSLDRAVLDAYAKNIEELNRITATKKNQIAKLTEWLVQLVENPLMRSEGTRELSGSFNALRYSEEEETDEEDAAENKKPEIKEPIVLDKNFRAENSPEIAESLTASQKQRLSAVLSNLISEDLQKFNRGNANNEEEIYLDYNLMSIVGYWDKNNLAMTSYAFLTNSGNSNPLRVSYLMSIISNSLEDEDLSEISSEYESAASEPDDAETEDEENVAAESAENFFASVAVETETETNAETETAEVEKTEVVPVVEETPKPEEKIEKPSAKISYKLYREKLFAKFTKQYGITISQSVASN